MDKLISDIGNTYGESDKLLFRSVSFSGWNKVVKRDRRMLPTDGMLGVGSGIFMTNNISEALSYTSSFRERILLIFNIDSIEYNTPFGIVPVESELYKNLAHLKLGDGSSISEKYTCDHFMDISLNYPHKRDTKIVVIRKPQPISSLTVVYRITRKRVIRLKV